MNSQVINIKLPYLETGMKIITEKYYTDPVFHKKVVERSIIKVLHNFEFSWKIMISATM